MRQWLSNGLSLRVSVISWTEFLCGPVDPSLVSFLDQMLGEPLPFERNDAGTTAKLFNSTGRRRGSLLDCMIAAVAMREGASLATSNSTDFARFQSFGLRLEKL